MRPDDLTTPLREIVADIMRSTRETVSSAR